MQGQLEPLLATSGFPSRLYKDRPLDLWTAICSLLFASRRPSSEYLNLKAITDKKNLIDEPYAVGF